MLQRLKLLKATVRLYAGDHGITVPAANEWQLMEKVIRLLQPFFEVTKNSVESNQSCGRLFPMLLLWKDVCPHMV